MVLGAVGKAIASVDSSCHPGLTQTFLNQGFAARCRGLDVASSGIDILESAGITRAMAIRWRCPRW